ncbi:MAG: hypothetical protein QW331_02095, partial [Candidatus Woesearchaeota archaeon]
MKKQNIAMLIVMVLLVTIIFAEEDSSPREGSTGSSGGGGQGTSTHTPSQREFVFQVTVGEGKDARTVERRIAAENEAAARDELNMQLNVLRSRFGEHVRFELLHEATTGTVVRTERTTETTQNQVIVAEIKEGDVSTGFYEVIVGGTSLGRPFISEEEAKTYADAIRRAYETLCEGTPDASCISEQ